jgi:glycosyltransferase involved in cell wall biosynthesis
MNKTLRILGTRGVPAAHGGFETFAEHLALYLVKRGWRVVVYCQEEGRGPTIEDSWEGVDRVRIPVPGDGPKATMLFDWKATANAARHRDLCLTLGYNTAVFCARLRLQRIPNIINMDGIEWARGKWGRAARTWFWLNDWAGCWLGDHLVADHPEIKTHLSTRVHPSKITTIPYGANEITQADAGPLTSLGLEPGRFLTLIARAEPENSIREVVSGFSRRSRGVTLAVLGKYEASNPYHRAVKSAAGAEVRFLGPIYDGPSVSALRAHSLAYVHGHRVGGTNPSLVEALGAGNAVIAHDNRFNRWVVGDGARFFKDASAFDDVLSSVLAAPACLLAMREASRRRFDEAFQWSGILGQYEALLEQYLPRSRAARRTPHTARA